MYYYWVCKNVFKTTEAQKLITLNHRTNLAFGGTELSLFNIVDFWLYIWSTVIIFLLIPFFCPLLGVIVLPLLSYYWSYLLKYLLGGKWLSPFSPKLEVIYLSNRAQVRLLSLPFKGSFFIVFCLYSLYFILMN